MDWSTTLARIAEQLIAGGVVVLLVQQILEVRRRKAQEAADKRERATRLQVFALEAVELQERWVQYSRQALIPEISRSSPFELTTADQVNELIEAGADPKILASIYFVKEGNNDVRRMVMQAQAEDSKLKGTPVGILREMPPAQLMVPQMTFNSSAAFVRDRWDRTSKAVDDILTAADLHGADVKDHRARSKAYCEEFARLKPRLVDGAQKEPPHKDGVPVPIK